ncbi:MAG: M28 family peptidase [Planctomycetes bacterium]|nr:M28 family peptidase [Planctomycetota bacterium]MCB9910291.1 M28 family peptidase [Planctomycetota bacterium]
MKPLLLLSLLWLPLAGLAPAQKQAQTDDLTRSNLERALEAVQPNNIKADLYFLADDAMAGRNSPSVEQRIAARFLRSRLMRLGFEPGFHDAYLFPYEKARYALDADACQLTLTIGKTAFQLKIGQDYFLSPSARSERHSEQAPILYLGDARDAHKVEAPVEGAWVLVDGDRRPSRSTQSKLFERGALGMLVMPSGEDGKSVADTYGRYFANMTELGFGEIPEANQPGALFLAESAAEHLQPLLKGLKPGAKLACTVSETCSLRSDPAKLENVIGIWPGSDPVLRNDVIILSAHYDHVGVRDDGDVYNGADDNGSGTSGMLALCEALAQYGPMRRTIMIQWVSAEEKGLWGSYAWTTHPWFPEGMKPVCNINIDMIGRNAEDELLITPTKNHEEYSWLTQMAEKHRSEEGFKSLGSADDYYWRSDHANYRKNLNVPVIFLFADIHEDYHKVTDTPDKINYNKITHVVRLVLRILDDLQDDKLG